MNVLDRFQRYVRIDTQSDPESTTFPSTEKQKDLSRMLAEELREMGLTDAEMDRYGYVYATLPASPGHENEPVICFCSHVDTSPDSSGKNVKPLVHANYDGRDLVLPDDPAIVIRQADHPDLKDQHGNRIVTASGTTLLGADNKAGVAAIMAAVEHLLAHPEIPHGKLRILFTPDEEVGRGVDHVDIDRLGADFGYTVDGATRGSIEDETFSADGATLHIEGVSAHPGIAKGKMESAIRIAGDILSALPKDRLRPEATEGREGFVHPMQMSGTAEAARIEFIIRDFETARLTDHAEEIRKVAAQVLKEYPHSTAKLEVREQYRNLKEVLDRHPEVIARAEAAMHRLGIPLAKGAIRGGTDGSRLSFMGLPCPNIFAGEHAFHSKQEWVSVEDMQDSARLIVEIARVANE